MTFFPVNHRALIWTIIGQSGHYSNLFGLLLVRSGMEEAALAIVCSLSVNHFFFQVFRKEGEAGLKIYVASPSSFSFGKGREHVC